MSCTSWGWVACRPRPAGGWDLLNDERLPAQRARTACVCSIRRRSVFDQLAVVGALGSKWLLETGRAWALTSRNLALTTTPAILPAVLWQPSGPLAALFFGAGNGYVVVAHPSHETQQWVPSAKLTITGRIRSS